MKRASVAILCFWILIGITSCSSTSTSTAPSLPATTPEPIPVAISLKQVSEAFTSAGLPVSSPVVYDERSDPNGILGRPGRYVEKMNFTDSRIKPPSYSSYLTKEQKQEMLLNCSIEIFKNVDDAKVRHDYLEAVGRPSGKFDSYRFLHRNVLVRIDLALIPSEAEEYRRVLETIQ